MNLRLMVSAMIEQHALLSKKIWEVLLQSGTTLIVCHKKPDGDTLGSALALSFVLDTLQKRNYVFCIDQPSEELDFLPQQKKVISDPSFLYARQFSAIVVVDAGDEDYTGIGAYIRQSHNFSFIINIDHHATNTFFGNCNLVDATASSTAEIMYRIFQWNALPIDKQIALCLLTGLLTDTYAFSNPATNFSSLEVASHLVSYGVRVHKIIEQLERTRTFSALNLWGEVLSNLIINEQWQVAIAVVTEAKLHQYDVDEHVTEGLANFVSHYCDMPVIMVLKQVDAQTIKGSLRTTHATVDVAALAQVFGGGGHRKAAGFTLQGKLVEHDGAWVIHHS